MLAFVLQVKVEMELEIQQCEKTKAVREEQLERLTQICQEQAVRTKHISFTKKKKKKACEVVEGDKLVHGFIKSSDYSVCGPFFFTSHTYLPKRCNCW